MKYENNSLAMTKDYIVLIFFFEKEISFVRLVIR